MAKQSSMNSTKAIFVGIFLITVIGLISYLIFLQPEQSTTQSDPTDLNLTQTSDDQKNSDSQGDQPTQSETSLSPASYSEYSPERFQQASSSKRVLFFYANWCPTCRPVDQEFTQNTEEIPQGVSVIRVNYNDSDTDDNEKALAKKYGVTYQHTFVQIDSEGNEVAKWNGGQSEELIENLK